MHILETKHSATFDQNHIILNYISFYPLGDVPIFHHSQYIM